MYTQKSSRVVYRGWCQSVIGVFNLDLGWDTVCLCVCVSKTFCVLEPV